MSAHDLRGFSPGPLHPLLWALLVWSIIATGVGDSGCSSPCGEEADRGEGTVRQGGKRSPWFSTEQS